MLNILIPAIKSISPRANTCFMTGWWLLYPLTPWAIYILKLSTISTLFICLKNEFTTILLLFTSATFSCHSLSTKPKKCSWEHCLRCKQNDLITDMNNLVVQKPYTIHYKCFGQCSLQFWKDQYFCNNYSIGTICKCHINNDDDIITIVIKFLVISIYHHHHHFLFLLIIFISSICTSIN